MIRAAVIGHPINHSRSPKIHGHWLRTHGIDGEYIAIDIPPENLVAGVAGLVDAGYAGFNVTLPHKQTIIQCCDEVDFIARAIGAVNTVEIRDGRLYGTNTDAYGFVENLKSSEPELGLLDETVAVIGAGGAARAIVYALTHWGVKQINLTNRTIEHAHEIADDFANVNVIPWNERTDALHDCALLVNTTSLGMSGQPALELDLSNLPVSAVVNDIVYTPLLTSLLLRAEGRGNKIVTGIGMLLHQARPGFRMWFGVDTDVTPDLERAVLS